MGTRGSTRASEPVIDSQTRELKEISSKGVDVQKL